MTSILSRLLTTDKPWLVRYDLAVQQYPDGVSGNEYPNPKVGKKKKNSKRSAESPVRFGRVPKREKAKILAAMQKVNACSQEKAMCAEIEDEYKIMTTIIRAHEETCDFTTEKVTGIVEKTMAQPVYAQCPPHLACPLNPAPHIMDNSSDHVEDFSERFAPAIKGVVEFAKRIPGFSFLSQDDQVTLLKAGVFEVLLVRLACMFDSQANSLICLNGQVLRRDSLHSASNARFLLDSMFDFSERLNALHLSDNEVGLFCAVVIISPDRPGLRNSDLVTKMWQKITSVLQKSIANTHPENPGLYADLMKKIPDLRTLNTLHSEKLLAYKMEAPSVHPMRVAGTIANSIDGIASSSIANGNSSTHPVYAISPEMLYYNLPNHGSPPEETRSGSPGVHSTNGSSTTGSDSWSSESTKDEHDVGSPDSDGSGNSIDEAKNSPPYRTSSFPNTNGYVNEEPWPVDVNQAAMMYHHHIAKRLSENPVSDHANSSCEDNYYNINTNSPPKASVYPQLHRVDSPTDSGIESGKEHGPSISPPTISNCSSPQSSVEEKLKDERHSPIHDKQDNIEDMPVLKRALQAPPLVNTNMLMDEAYRHHKKFRAARREVDSPSSPPQMSLASTHSTLVRTLAQPARYLNEQQLKRTDLLHSIILQNEALPEQLSPPLPQHPQTPSQNPSQSHHVEALPAKCPSLQNGYSYNSVPNQIPSQTATSLSPSNGQQHKNVLICPSTYFVTNASNVQPASIYSASTPAVWPYTQQQQPTSTAPTVTSPPLMQLQYEQQMQQNTAKSYCASSTIVNSRAGSPRQMYNPRCSPVTSSTLVMNGLNSSIIQSTLCANERKSSGESQPLNLSKKFSAHMVKIES